MMARDLAHRPDEVPRICRMLDLVAHGAAGHGPVLISAAEIGLAWDGDESGWIWAALHPRRMLSGSIQHFQRAPFEAWQLKVCAQLTDRKVFFAVRSSWISEDLYNCFSHLRKRDKVLLRSILCGGVWNVFLPGKATDEEVKCRFCGSEDGDGHLFLGLLHSPNSLCPGAPGVYAVARDRGNLLWHGCLVLALLASETLVLHPWVSWLIGRWNRLWFCIDVSGEHTPIKLPTRNIGYQQEYDVTIAASEDLNLPQHAGASSSSQHTAASTVPTLWKLGSLGTSLRKLWADYDSCKSDWQQGNLR